MHIPKTAGSALTSALQAALAPATAISGFDRCMFGGFQDFDSLGEGVRNTIYASAAALPKNADFVAGHMAFSTLHDAYPQGRRLTLLREPVSRLLSLWLFWRQHTDADLASWGKWAKRVRLSRQPLSVFLSEPLLACQTDNQMIRMLLWPHPLIPTDDFIDAIHEKHLLRAAMKRLRHFDFRDVVENQALMSRLQLWLKYPLNLIRHNETAKTPQQWRTSLHQEITQEAYDLLAIRSRLDERLWTEIARDCMPGRDIEKLRQQTILTNVARYAAL